MKIGIYGAGSIGCFIGANLIANGQEVIFLGREKLKKEVLENGLHISSISSKNFSINADKINFSTDINSIINSEIILFTMKSGDTISSALELKKVLSDKKPILISFQNGVSNAKKISSIFSELNVLAGMVPYNVINLGKGKFHSGTSGVLLIEERKNISNKILELFIPKLEIKSHSNIEAILWGKLIFNLNNAINALAGIPLKEELSNPKFRKILSKTMLEALNILKKSNIPILSLGKMIPKLAPYILNLPNFLFFRIASSMIKIDPEARSSMWEDLNYKRKVEFDFINGEILNLARKNNLEAPIQEKIEKLIKEAEEKKLGSPKYSAEQLEELLF